MSSDKPMNRRRFFRHGLAELIKPLGGVIKPFEELAKQVGSLEDLQPKPPPKPAVEIRKPTNTVSFKPPSIPGDDDVDDATYFIRPPGARVEQDFLNVCSRCANCVHVCPVNAIQMDPSSRIAGGVPYIDP